MHGTMNIKCIILCSYVLTLKSPLRNNKRRCKRLFKESLSVTINILPKSSSLSSQLTLISAGYSVHLLCVGRVPSDKVREHADRSVW